MAQGRSVLGQLAEHGHGRIAPCNREHDADRHALFFNLPAGASVRFAQAVRQHWGRENSFHWVLDVSRDEEACRIRKAQGA